jgi:hypothetical protein
MLTTHHFLIILHYAMLLKVLYCVCVCVCVCVMKMSHNGVFVHISSQISEN